MALRAAHLITIAFLALNAAGEADSAAADVAAEVNGRIITVAELNYYLTPIREQLAAEMPEKGLHYYASLRRARDDILAELIEREHLLAEFRKNVERRVPADEVDRTMNLELRKLGKTAGERNRTPAQAATW